MSSGWRRPGARCSESESESSSGDDGPDGCSSSTVKRKRALPYGAFAQALKSTRLHDRSSNYSSNPIFGNPRYGNIMMLYCRTGWHLKVENGGKVYGIREENDRNAIFEILPAGQVGHVFIRSIENKLYIAFNKKGRLYGEPRSDLGETVWLEEFLGSYTTYMSRSYAHLGWYLGIKKSGKPKNGNRTDWGQKAIQFLPRRLQN